MEIVKETAKEYGGKAVKEGVEEAVEVPNDERKASSEPDPEGEGGGSEYKYDEEYCDVFCQRLKLEAKEGYWAGDKYIYYKH